MLKHGYTNPQTDTNKHKHTHNHTHPARAEMACLRTAVAGGSAVSGGGTVTVERAPGLSAPASMFTVIGGTPGRERDRDRERERRRGRERDKKDEENTTPMVALVQGYINNIHK